MEMKRNKLQRPVSRLSPKFLLWWFPWTNVLLAFSQIMALLYIVVRYCFSWIYPVLNSNTAKLMTPRFTNELMGGVKGKKRGCDPTSEQIAAFPGLIHPLIPLSQCQHLVPQTEISLLISPIILSPPFPWLIVMIFPCILPCGIISPSSHVFLSFLIHLISCKTSYGYIITQGSVKVEQHLDECGSSPAINSLSRQERKWHAHIHKIPRILEMDMLKYAEC